MKKIFCLVGLLFASNAISQQLNMNAIFSGNTSEVVCYAFSEAGNPTAFRSIDCKNKAGGTTGRMTLGVQANEHAFIAGFVASGRWDLATTLTMKDGVTVWIFTKR